MSDLVIKKSPVRIVVLFILGIIMTYLAWMLTKTGGYMGIIGWLGVILFGMGVIFYPLNYLRYPQALILSNDGIRDYSSMISLGDKLIPWERISNIQPGRGRREIYLELTNHDEFLAELTPYKRAMNQMNKSLGFGLAMSFQQAKYPKGMSHQDLIQTMYEYRDNRLKQVGL